MAMNFKSKTLIKSQRAFGRWARCPLDIKLGKWCQTFTRNNSNRKTVGTNVRAAVVKLAIPTQMMKKTP